MSQIVVSCRRSQLDSHHCHPHEEHCSPLTCSYSHSQVLAEPWRKVSGFYSVRMLKTHLCHISRFSQGVSITWVFTSSIKSMGPGVKTPSMRSWLVTGERKSRDKSVNCLDWRIPTPSYSGFLIRIRYQGPWWWKNKIFLLCNNLHI